MTISKFLVYVYVDTLCPAENNLLAIKFVARIRYVILRLDMRLGMTFCSQALKLMNSSFTDVVVLNT